MKQSLIVCGSLSATLSLCDTIQNMFNIGPASGSFKGTFEEWLLRVQKLSVKGNFPADRVTIITNGDMANLGIIHEHKAHFDSITPSHLPKNVYMILFSEDLPAAETIATAYPDFKIIQLNENLYK